MSWTTRITKAPNGELRLLFPEPLSHIDMDRATAKHFASLLDRAASEKVSPPLDAVRGDAPRAELNGAARANAERGCLMYLCGWAPHGPTLPANDDRPAEARTRWVTFKTPEERAFARAQLLGTARPA